LLLMTTAALPQLEQHNRPNLGRLITPRHYPRLADTLTAGYPTAADNDCRQGLDAKGVCAMLEAIAPWPSVGARIRRAWPGSERAARAVPLLAHVAVSRAFLPGSCCSWLIVVRGLVSIGRSFLARVRPARTPSLQRCLFSVYVLSW
jgi:hypothetical protein